MINIANIQKLIGRSLNYEPIKISELEQIGLSLEDVTDLVSKGILSGIQKGYYIVKNVDFLLVEGRDAFNKEDYELASKYFETYLNVNENSLDAYYNLFLSYVGRQKYDDAFNLLNILIDYKNKYLADINYYLLLLSNFLEIPEKYVDYVSSLKLEDILINENDDRFVNVDSENEIRKYVLKQAIRKIYINIIILERKYGRQNNQVLVKKLCKLIEQAEKNKDKLKLDLIKEKKYELLKQEISLKKNLSSFDELKLILINKYLEIDKSKIVPEVKKLYYLNIYDAIDSGDFFQVLEFHTEYLRKRKITLDDNIVYLIIKDIISLIATINNDLREENDNRVSFINNIMTALINKDTDKAFRDLSIYLKDIKKSEYEFLIINLIKISLLEKDGNFTKIKLILRELGNNEYKYEVADIINEFYFALAKRRLDIARLYLEILKNGSALGEECVLIDNMESILKASEDKAKEDNMIENGNIEEINKEIKFIEDEYVKLIKNKGIIILKGASARRRQIISKIVKDYKDIALFNMDEEIILRYAPNIGEKLDVTAIISLAQKEFKMKNYQNSINYYLELLEVVPNPKHFIYAALAWSYYHMKNYGLAIDYFRVADYLAKREHVKKDYTELIRKSRKKLNIGKKPYQYQEEKQFNITRILKP